MARNLASSSFVLRGICYFNTEDTEERSFTENDIMQTKFVTSALMLQVQ